MRTNQKLESIKKTFQEYNLDLKRINEVIEEIEAYITNYQGIKRRLDNISKNSISYLSFSFSACSSPDKYLFNASLFVHLIFYTPKHF